MSLRSWRKLMSTERVATFTETPDNLTRRHIGKITVAQRVLQIPSHAQQDDLVFEVSPTEQSRPILSHSSHPIRTASRRLQQIPSK